MRLNLIRYLHRASNEQRAKQLRLLLKIQLSGQFQLPSTTQYDNFNHCQSSLYTDNRFDNGFPEISSAEGDFVPSLFDSQPGCLSATVEKPSDKGAQFADI